MVYRVFLFKQYHEPLNRLTLTPYGVYVERSFGMWGYVVFSRFDSMCCARILGISYFGGVSRFDFPVKKVKRLLRRFPHVLRFLKFIPYRWGVEAGFGVVGGRTVLRYVPDGVSLSDAVALCWGRGRKKANTTKLEQMF